MLRQIAKAIRHHPMLERADPLWNALRKPYHLALGFGGYGTKVLVGGRVAVRIPPDLSVWDLEQWEPEAIDALSKWVKQHPGGVLIDIGSSFGIFSGSAMFLDPKATVIAIDGDLESVVATRRFCQYAPAPCRLTAIHGLITDAALPCSLTEAIARTEASLLATGARGTSDNLRYRNLNDTSKELPRYKLDDLLVDVIGSRPTLIKCDVEGAELHVLRGAVCLLRKLHCNLLLSVHPQYGMMERYGHTVHDVAKFLEDLDYCIEVLAIDWEEHWWCTPRVTSGSSDPGSLAPVHS